MLKYGNRDFRNLQEQVYANMKNIQDIIDGSNIIADFKTVNIVGQVSDDSELPDPDTYTGDYGDAILVGTDEDFDLYVFTKAYESENAPQWFNMGKFPQPGPQGPKGDKGEPGEGIRDASELAAFMEGSNSIQVALNQDESKVKFDAKVGDGLKITANGIEAKVGVGVEIDENGALSANIPNALVLPEEAPGVQQLVGIGPTGVQNALGIGSGLDISSGNIVIEATEKGKIDNSLQLPGVAPVSTQLAAIGPSGTQVNLGIGDMLEVKNAELNLRVYEANFNSGTSINLSVEEYAALFGGDESTYPFFIRVKNHSTAAYNTLYMYDKKVTAGDIYYIAITRMEPSPSASGNGIYKFSFDNNIPLLKVATGRAVSVSTIKILRDVSSNAERMNSSIWTTTSGTATGVGTTWTSTSDYGAHFAWRYTDTNSVQHTIDFKVYSYDNSSKAIRALGYELGPNNIVKTYVLTIENTKHYDIRELAGGVLEPNLIGNFNVYESVSAVSNLGEYAVYQDLASGEMYITLDSTNNLELKVYDTGSSEIAVANKSITDYSTGDAGIIKVRVATDGTNYYLANGLLKDATLTLGFTKPATAVGSIKLICKMVNGNNTYYLTPDALFAGSDAINSIPAQYNGINRATVTSMTFATGTIITLSGSEITFGADTSVNASICLQKGIVKAIAVNQ